MGDPITEKINLLNQKLDAAEARRAGRKREEEKAKRQKIRGSKPKPPV
jgi:hypothetical protein